jgi:uncharacterized protein
MKRNTTKKIAVYGAVAIVGIIIILSAINIAFGQNKSFELTNDASGSVPDTKATVVNGVQNVKLSMQGVTYIMQPSTLKLGVPVRMEVDMDSVNGCMRTVVIPSAGIRQSVSEGNNIIQFTPQSSGTFQITCGMGMGRGTFKVEASDGTVANAVEKPSSAGSCGANGGGCGCGAR